MKECRKNLKVSIMVAIMALPMFVSAQGLNDSDYYLVSGPNKVDYYEKAPYRLFIYKDSTVSKDYIISLLGKLTDSEFEFNWINTSTFKDNLCRVVVDDCIIDSLIVELAKDEAVLMARRIFEPKGIQQKIIDNPELENESTSRFSYSQRYEILFFNDIVCFPLTGKLEPQITDSLCNKMGLTAKEETGLSITFAVSKTADIFQISHCLLNTDLFYNVHVDQLQPYRYIMSVNEKANEIVNQEKYFFDVSGYITDNPSRPTIVVTRNSDGTIRSEKKLLLIGSE